MFSNLASLLTAIVLAGIFLLSGHFSIEKTLGLRRALSAAAGASVAYIFVNLLPEIETIAIMFHHEAKSFMPYEGAYGVNIAMMMGFVFFYGLEEMKTLRTGSIEKNRDKVAFWVQIMGYGGYISLIGYLLVRSLVEEELSRLLYAVSMSMHFSLIGFGLRDVHKEDYDRVGRYVLAGFCLGGWLVGMMAELPKFVVMLLFGFVSGGVLSVTGIVELPKGEEGRFLPFLSGAVAYAAFLIIFR